MRAKNEEIEKLSDEELLKKLKNFKNLSGALMIIFLALLSFTIYRKITSDSGSFSFSPIFFVFLLLYMRSQKPLEDEAKKRGMKPRTYSTSLKSSMRFAERFSSRYFVTSKSTRRLIS